MVWVGYFPCGGRELSCVSSQVVGLVEKRADQLDYILVDTPGQIEIFTWSASGAIITEAFASTFPTVVCYVIDTPRSASPVTFMSNMLYACGILYKTRLPMLLAFNKTDVKKHDFALEVHILGFTGSLEFVEFSPGDAEFVCLFSSASGWKTLRYSRQHWMKTPRTLPASAGACAWFWMSFTTI